MVKPQAGLKRSLKAAINHARRARHVGEPYHQLAFWHGLVLSAKAKLRICAPEKKAKLLRLAVELEDEIALIQRPT